MLFKQISKTVLTIVLAALVFTSCDKEQITPIENYAFSSNGPAIPDVNVGSDKTFYKFYLNNGKPVWSDQGRYWLGIVADEKVREVYIFTPSKHTDWQRIDSNSADKDPDALLRNGSCGLFNPDKEGLKAYAVGPLVYVAFGNKYATLRVDAGEVFRKSGICGQFPSGISCVDYLPFKNTYDFNGSGFFVGVTDEGYVAGSSSIEGPYVVPTGKSSSDVNSVNSKGTAGNVTCLDVVSNKAVKFTLTNGKVVRGSAQRAKHEFIKVD